MRTEILVTGIAVFLVGSGLFIFFGLPFLQAPPTRGKVRIPFTDWEITVGVETEQYRRGQMLAMMSAVVVIVGFVLMIVGLLMASPSRPRPI